MLNDAFSNDEELRDAILSEDVQEVRRLEESLAALNLQTPRLLSEMGYDPEAELSPDDISNILGNLF